MYEDRYGTDWETLGHDEVVERAYALGVESVVDSADEAEYERLLTELDGYDRSIVELAYNEGRSEALNLRGEAGSAAAVWEELVEEELATAVEGAETGSSPDGPVESEPPELMHRLGALDRPSATELPERLRRD